MDLGDLGLEEFERTSGLYLARRFDAKASGGGSLTRIPPGEELREVVRGVAGHDFGRKDRLKSG